MAREQPSQTWDLQIYLISVISDKHQMEPVIAGSIFVNPNLERGTLCGNTLLQQSPAIAAAPSNLLLNKFLP